jgi:hypothetical protein
MLRTGRSGANILVVRLSADTRHCLSLHSNLHIGRGCSKL